MHFLSQNMHKSSTLTQIMRIDSNFYHIQGSFVNFPILFYLALFNNHYPQHPISLFIKSCPFFKWNFIIHLLFHYLGCSNKWMSLKIKEASLMEVFKLILLRYSWLINCLKVLNRLKNKVFMPILIIVCSQ